MFTKRLPLSLSPLAATRSSPWSPSFITPQDGHAKQDCEQVAAKRWIERQAGRYQQVTILGDDLYCKQPFCELLLDHGFNFILVC